MNGGDIDKWLFDGVAEELAAARAINNGQPPAPAAAPSPPATSPTKAPTSPSKVPSLATRGIGRGGVIRNQSTKIRTQGDNPVTNPRPSHDPKAVGAKAIPTDAQAEAKASNPALAAPSLFTGMDIDMVKKGTPAPAPVQERIFSSVAPPLAASSTDTVVPNDDVVRFDTTVRQLIEIAQRQPKKMVHVSTSRFVLSLELFKNPSAESPASTEAAPETP